MLQVKFTLHAKAGSRRAIRVDGIRPVPVHALDLRSRAAGFGDAQFVIQGCCTSAVSGAVSSDLSIALSPALANLLYLASSDTICA